MWLGVVGGYLESVISTYFADCNIVSEKNQQYFNEAPYVMQQIETRLDSFRHQNTMCIFPCKRKIYGRNISVYCFCISVSHSPFIRTLAYEPYVSGIYKSPINRRFFYTRTRYFLFMIVIIDNLGFLILYNTRPYVEKRLYCF